MKHKALYLLKSVIGGGKSFCFALTLSSLTLPLAFASCEREAIDPADSFDTRTPTDSTKAAGGDGATVDVDTTWAGINDVNFDELPPSFTIPDSIPVGDAGEAA